MKCARAVPLLFSLLSLFAPSVFGATALDKREHSNHNGRKAARPTSPKYFQEPGSDPTLGHYDKRYYHGLIAYGEHQAILQHLIRSYLLTSRSLGIETWIAHGTLLGWWWNGRIMPWDYDLDVQVSDVTLFYMAQNYNRTIYTYRYRDESGREFEREYLLDINPYHANPRSDGQNIIDARWIDTSNGMFVDITSLAERDPRRAPGIWSCKNFHRYRTRELYPLRETEFEGVPASIPYSFDRVLTAEYGQKSLVITQFQKHKWDDEIKEWVQMSGNRTIVPHTTPAPNPVTMTDRKGGDVVVQDEAEDNADDSDDDSDDSAEESRKFVQSG
ncbi:mannosylphosphate transferase [Grosmannia clavigera kw1407]|uniref:Mannosylphosphate transferase n=1 Tax=Grosmannia clavigera (strain kw1407 / UAMH 11150) TaxID=655863 RepID=F0X7G5_GROCL|nr:mannosylphosphate transferase [Grosmannia clavigera kw1407]EFX06535.1 mannosylphosphate transferase [Grosmannia clavigera kw1407]